MNSVSISKSMNLNSTLADEKKLIAKLDRTKNEIKHLKVAGTTYDFGTLESDNINDELLIQRARYFNILKKLNVVRAKKKRETIKSNSKNMKKAGAYFDKLRNIDDDRARKIQSYRSKLTTKFMTGADVRYKTSVFDTLVY